MNDKYRVDDIIIINKGAVGSLRPNEIGIISRVDREANNLYPYTIFSVADPYRHDVYNEYEIKHLF